jgi:hypothetical protein
VQCPNCGSGKTRRGGTTIWIVYLVLIALAIPAVVVFDFDAAIVAGIMIAVIILVNLVVATRICLDCGHQWRP